ncbi:hypothetical protein HD554DRAFT_1534263 [Boletus coccyginus]|nr:hypothetical protein HD554DRAFT_1534263 [Boletus coccyginus]
MWTRIQDSYRYGWIVSMRSVCGWSGSTWFGGAKNVSGQDAEYLNKLHAEGGPRVDYVPVMLSGGSVNPQKASGMEDIRRNGGRFLWQQIYNARRAGVRTIYGTMWDEYDEGTACWSCRIRLGCRSTHRTSS